MATSRVALCVDAERLSKYHAYTRFLPCNKSTTQAFWVKGIVLKPAGEFDRLWANAR